jgi:hypothetical protein
MSKVDALTSRVEAFEAKRRADEEQQREFEEEPLELPPDLDRPQDLPPSPIGDDETHQPGGELHAVSPKDEEHLSELPEPPLEPETTADGGKVPLSYGNVPTSYVHGGPRDAAASNKDNVGDLPKELEDPPEPPPEPKGSVYPQPVSISLNKA